MVCQKCNRKLRIAPEQVGIDRNGLPIFSRMGYCDTCMIKYNLDAPSMQPQQIQVNLVTEKKENACGIVGLVFSCLGFFWPLAIIGILLSLISLFIKNTKKVCGTLGLIFGIMFISARLLIPQFISYVERARENSVSEVGSSDIQEESETMFRVGETAEVKGVQVTMTDYYESTGGEWNKPDEGNVFVLVEFEIVNNRKKDIVVSSVMSFSAYADDYVLDFSIAAIMDRNGQQLDGTIASGKKLKGWIGWEVPADYHDIEIHFTDSVWSDNKVVFLIEK